MRIPCGDGDGGSRILAAIGLGFILTVAGFKVVVPDDPYADLSDTYLEKLKGDDDVANDAARKVRRDYMFLRSSTFCSLASVFRWNRFLSTCIATLAVRAGCASCCSGLPRHFDVVL